MVSWLRSKGKGILLAFLVFGNAARGFGQEEPEVRRAEKGESRSLVWTALHPETHGRFAFEAGEVRRMTGRLVCAVTGRRTVAEAWKTLVPAKSRVGIRVCATGAPYAGTHPAVVAAVVNGLESAGIKRSSIVIWDRDLGLVKGAGYAEAAPGCRLAGVFPGAGFDKESPILAPYLGKLIWGDLLFKPVKADDPGAGEVNLSSTSHLSKVLARDVDVVINLPAASSGSLTGMDGGISQIVLANVDNWRRIVGKPSHGDPYLTEFYADPRIGGRVVLTIMDALVGQYAGGPGFEPNYLASLRTLLASRDPVAVDAVTMRLLDVRRKDAALPAMEKMSTYLETAAAFGLGRFAVEEIEVKPVASLDP